MKHFILRMSGITILLGACAPVDDTLSSEVDHNVDEARLGSLMVGTWRPDYLTTTSPFRSLRLSNTRDRAGRLWYYG
jgi:hypothetical protein